MIGNGGMGEWENWRHALSHSPEAPSPFRLTGLQSLFHLTQRLECFLDKLL